MSSEDIYEWELYSVHSPLNSHYRDDLRTGVIAAAVYNSQRARGPAVKPNEIMPDFEREVKPPMNDRQIRQVAMKLNALFGGKTIIPEQKES